jgi:penicillin-binding protein 1A
MAKSRKGANFWQIFKTVQLYFWAFILAVALFFVGVNEGLLGEMPDLESIQNPQTAISTTVWSADGEVLGTFYDENRIEVFYEDLSPYLVNALISTEDKRFYDHSGIDLKGLLRVIIKTGLMGQDAGGGSTITQQLAKNLFHQDAYKYGKWNRVKQKIKEWLLAAKIERTFTKDEIINLYFNTIAFGYNSYGIKTATFTYFYKKPKELNASESATLVAMLNGPSLFNPRLREPLTRERRNLVLSRMVEMNFISKEQFEKAKDKPIKLNFHNPDFREGIATYLRMMVREDVKRWCANNKKPGGGKYNIYKDGLNIYTTIDAGMQRAAEEAMQSHLPYLQSTFLREWKGKEPWKYGERAKPEIVKKMMKETGYYKELLALGKSEKEIEKLFNQKREMVVYDYRGINGIYNKDTMMSPLDSLKYYLQMVQCGFMAVDIKNGEIKAWIGGPHMRYFQLDHAKKSTKRQVGSTMKPLQYAVAIERGYSPCTYIPYLQPNCGTGNWNPAGTKRWQEGEQVPMQEGLWYSDNRITANLICDFSPEALVEMARKLGINSDLESVPALALGVSDISLSEMVGAYTAFANLGTQSQPFYIKKITDKKGNLLVSYNPKQQEALTESVAYTTCQMMKGVVDKGTAAKLRTTYGLKTIDLAGKTGTTQNNADAWFIGITPHLAVGTWVGFDQPSVHFASTATGQGGAAALPIVGKFLKKIYSQNRRDFSPNSLFSLPTDSTFQVEFNCNEIFVAP